MVFTCAKESHKDCTLPWLLGEVHPNFRNWLHLGQERVLAPGEILHAPGTPYTQLCLLVSGMLRVCCYREDKLVPLWIMCPGNILGESSLLTQQPAILTGEAIERSTLVCFDSDVLFGQILPKDPDITMAIMENMATKRYIATHRMDDGKVGITKRIETFIYICTAQLASAKKFKVDLTVDKIAELFNVKHSVVTRVLNGLIANNVIHMEDGHVFVKNIKKLGEDSSSVILNWEFMGMPFADYRK